MAFWTCSSGFVLRIHHVLGMRMYALMQLRMVIWMCCSGLAPRTYQLHGCSTSLTVDSVRSIYMRELAEKLISLYHIIILTQNIYGKNMLTHYTVHLKHYFNKLPPIRNQMPPSCTMGLPYIMTKISRQHILFIINTYAETSNGNRRYKNNTR